MSETTPTTISQETRPSRTAQGNTGLDRDDRRPRRAGQTATIVVLIVSLIAAMITRQTATYFQESNSPSGRRTTGSRTSLAGMDSYALALLLGGLRGPLVMILWAQSESQKSERNLEGIDTQIEWIRRLQPEFDTVHVFQMWNKAYNISVQMVGLANKYSTILDAVDYGRSIDAERPDNLNIIKEIGRIYTDKLGNANPEKHYFRERVRNETKHREATAAGNRPQQGEPGFQRLSHDTMLDANGNLLPEFLAVRFPGAEYDGSELQFLKQYQPFPYGLSPFALGYNYNKRAQVLMGTLKQSPIQVAESVTDAQPAITLKSWSEEEWERSRRMELKALGLKIPTDRIQLETPTAELPLDVTFKDTSNLAEIVAGYAISARLVGDSIKEYERHLANPEYATKRAMYISHLDHLVGVRELVQGDHDYLSAVLEKNDPAKRSALLASAAVHYQDSIRDNGITAMRYFTADRLAAATFPPGVTRATIGTGPLGSRTAVTTEDVLRIMQGIAAEVARTGGPDTDENAEDRGEYDTYIKRALTRLNLIQQATKR